MRCRYVPWCLGEEGHDDACATVTRLAEHVARAEKAEAEVDRLRALLEDVFVLASNHAVTYPLDLSMRLSSALRDGRVSTSVPTAGKP